MLAPRQAETEPASGICAEASAVSMTAIFRFEGLGNIDVDALLARCERVGSPFEKLSISPIN